MSHVAPGVCRHCDCTENVPCWACRAYQGECAWTDGTRTVCSAPACIKLEAARLAAARLATAEQKPKSRFAGVGYGAICEQLRREKRRRGRKRKAA